MLERRVITNEFEVRSGPTGKPYVEGYAAVFNRSSQNLGGFTEQVAPGTFAKTIQEADIRALFNHDPAYVLGRNKAGTLALAEDSTGLSYKIDLPDTTFARDLATSMERGDINSSSFSFRVIKDSWGFDSEDFPQRTLNEVALLDVGPVTFPAYLDATSNIAQRAYDALSANLGVTVTADNLGTVLRNPESVVEQAHSEPVVSTRNAALARRLLHNLNAKRIPFA